MQGNADFIWNSERNREFNVYRPCSCGTCSAVRRGVGFLSGSDAKGRGFTVWIRDEGVFLRLQEALERFRKALCEPNRKRTRRKKYRNVKRQSRGKKRLSPSTNP
jgi:hypothetical protein